MLVGYAMEVESLYAVMTAQLHSMLSAWDMKKY